METLILDIYTLYTKKRREKKHNKDGLGVNEMENPDARMIPALHSLYYDPGERSSGQESIKKTHMEEKNKMRWKRYPYPRDVFQRDPDGPVGALGNGPLSPFI